MSNPNTKLIIKSKIWKNDSADLIDYLNVETKNFKIKVSNSGVLRKQDKKIYFESGENLDKTEFDLVRVQKNESTGRYLINCGAWSKNLLELSEQTGAYMVYRGLTLKDLNKDPETRFYKLNQGDIFKIGKVYLKVLEIHLKKEKPNILNSSNSSRLIINKQQIIKGTYSPMNQNQRYNHVTFNKMNSLIKSRDNKFSQSNNSIDLFSKRKVFPLLPMNNYSNDLFILKKISLKNKKRNSSKDLQDILKKKENQNKNKKTKPTCRICYGEESNESNPLICPCICKGYMRYIHYDCLKNWLNSKIEEEPLEENYVRKPNCITYNRKNISCEICKVKFPDYIIHNNIYYNILFYKPKFEEFIILESFNSNSLEENIYYHILSLDHKEYITIGRSNNCDLTFPELSVSRNHSVIRKGDNNNSVYLEDNNSKFRTLVLIQNKNMIVNDFMSLNIQVNKTLIKFKLDVPFSWNCCARQDTKEKYDYQIQNKKGLNIMNNFFIKEDNINNDSSSCDENKDNNNNNKDILDKKNIIDNNKKNIVNNKENLIDESSEDNKNINDKDNMLVNDINNNNKNLIEINDEENNINTDIKNNKDINNNLNKANDANFLVNNLPTKRIKKLRIKKEKNEILKLPRIDSINLDKIKKNFYKSLLSDKNIDLNKIKINNNERNKIIYEQLDSFTNFKNSIIHKKNSLFPFETPEQSEFFKDNK